MSKKYIVLDFEGVVFKPRLREMYVDIFKQTGRDLSEMDYFFEKIFKEKYRSENCRDKSISDMINHIVSKYPDWEQELRAFEAHNQFDRFVDEVIVGMDKVVEYFTLSDKYELYGLTNWTADGFEVLESKFSNIVSKFKEVLVSGKVGVKKPDYKIWVLANEMMGNPNPEDVYFFDDKQRNVDRAREEVNWNSYLFTQVDDIFAVFPDVASNV